MRQSWLAGSQNFSSVGDGLRDQRPTEPRSLPGPLAMVGCGGTVGCAGSDPQGVHDSFLTGIALDLIEGPGASSGTSAFVYVDC